MLNDMEIQVRIKCCDCGGSGKKFDPIYGEFYAAEILVGEFTNDEFNQWFRDKGYQTPPPEEYTCESCDGTGKIIKWVSINDVIKSYPDTEADGYTFCGKCGKTNTI